MNRDRKKENAFAERVINLIEGGAKTEEMKMRLEVISTHVEVDMIEGSAFMNFRGGCLVVDLTWLGFTPTYKIVK